MSFNIVDPEWFLPRIVQGKGEGDENGILVGDFYCGHIVERACALWLGALKKGYDANDEEYRGGGQQQRLNRGQVALGGTEFVGDVDGGPGLGGCGRGVCGCGGRCWTGWVGWLIRHGFVRAFDSTPRRRDQFHSCFMALANFSAGKVFRTSFLVSQARRACRMP